MNAKNIIKTLRERGIALAPRDGRILAKPAALLDEADIEALRTHREEIIRILREESVLEANVRRMAAFYDCGEEETADMLARARESPDAWRVMTNASMCRWGWSLDDGAKHPWMPSPAHPS